MQIPGESIGIIADDLTGACDTGLQFHQEGGNVRVLLDYTAATQATSTQVWVINTESRHMESFDSVAAVKKSVHFLREKVGLDRFYKKIDSTLRGHIAQECLGILDELGWKAAVIAPAYPDEERRTIGGYQIVRGIPVGKTHIARDPLFPIRESHVPTLLGKSVPPELVGYIPLSKVMDGAGPILLALQEQIQMGKRLIVADACTDTDLEQLSLAINKMPSEINVLPCGSAGLAKALSKKWLIHTENTHHPTLRIEKTPLFFIIGSASPRTRLQIQNLIQELPHIDPDAQLEVVSLQPAEVLGLDSVAHKVQQITHVLQEGGSVILSSTLNEDDLDKTVLLAQEQSLTPDQVSAMATERLAQMASEILSQVQAKLIVSGGETALHVCKSLGVKSLQVTQAIEASIPLMIDEQARWIITKSGGFGSPLSFINLYKGLQQIELAPHGVR